MCHPAALSPTHTKHTDKRKKHGRGQCSVCTARARILCALLFPRMKDEVNLKKQSPAASSAQSTRFLDSSCAWLLSQRCRLWSPHSASHEQRHQARWKSASKCDGPKKPNQHQLVNMLKVGFGRGEEFPFNCRRGVHLRLPL